MQKKNLQTIISATHLRSSSIRMS